jgi:hypothetical protein
VKALEPQVKDAYTGTISRAVVDKASGDVSPLRMRCMRQAGPGPLSVMLGIVTVVVLLVALFASRGLVRERVIRPVIERYGPVPWWLLFALIAALVIWRWAQVDASPGGMLHLMRLIVFLATVFYLIWPRKRD